MAARALLTGATGLIGRYVEKAWDVPGLELVTVDHHVDDLLVPGVAGALIEQLRPAVVIHLAWCASGTTGYRNSPDNDAWVASSLEMARGCAACESWFVATGTGLDTESAAGDAYAAAKVRLRQLLEPAIAAGEITWLRPFYVIDPVVRRPALLADALAARETGAILELRTPEAEHDFVHAADVGSAVLAVLRHELRGVVSIGSGRLRRVRELIDALGVLWTTTGGFGADDPQYHEAADSTRLHDLGWSPTITENLFACE